MLLELDVGGGGVAGVVAVPDGVPALIAAGDCHLGATGDGGDDGAGGGGIGPEIQGRGLGDHHPLMLRRGLDEGQAEILAQGLHQIPGDGAHVGADPGGVGGVVVVADLDEHRRAFGAAHLPQGGGGAGGDQVGQGVDAAEILGKQLRRPLPRR